MANSYFQFKQFTVFHGGAAMKVGVDGVLLGAWANVGGAKKILDIGAGSGLLTLMMAQRCPQAKIDAVEIDRAASEQAFLNISQSAWLARIKIENQAIQDFAQQTKKSYDLIISNPPYFINSLQTPDFQRTIARHTTDLTHEELIFCAEKLLAENGKIAFILPVFEAEKIIETAEAAGLFLTRKTHVFPKPNTQAKRILMELEREEKLLQENALTVETDIRGVYTTEYIDIVKDFYLKM